MSSIEFGLINRGLLMRLQSELVEKICGVCLDQRSKNELTYVLLRAFLLEVCEGDLKGRFPGLFYPNGIPMPYGGIWKNFIDITINFSECVIQEELIYEKLE